MAVSFPNPTERTSVQSTTISMHVRFATGPETTESAQAGSSYAPEIGGLSAIRRGTNIVSWDLQRVGRVRRVEVDRVTGMPASLVVHCVTGAPTVVTLSARFIERIVAGEVYLSLSLEQVKEMV